MNKLICNNVEIHLLRL